MIYLTSNGITSKTLRSHFKARCKGGKAAIITTASVDYKEKDKHIPAILDLLAECGYTTRFYDLEVDRKEDLLVYDLIYINGGNPFYLMHQINRNDFKGVFKRLHERQTPIVGVSAGSMVLTPSLNMVKLLDPGLNVNVGLKDYSGLALVDFELCPHYERFSSKFDAFDKKVQEYAHNLDEKFVKLRDGEAIFIEKGKKVLIRVEGL